MPEDFDEHAAPLEDIVRRLTGMVVRMDEMLGEQRQVNTHLAAAITELKEFNRQQLLINADIHTTLADIKTLLERLPRGGTNGRDA